MLLISIRPCCFLSVVIRKMCDHTKYNSRKTNFFFILVLHLLLNPFAFTMNLDHTQPDNHLIYLCDDFRQNSKTISHHYVADCHETALHTKQIKLAVRRTSQNNLKKIDDFLTKSEHTRKKCFDALISQEIKEISVDTFNLHCQSGQ